MFLPVTVTSSGGEVSADPTGAATAAAGKSVVTTATVTSTGIAVETVTGKNSGEVSTSGSERKTESSTAGLAMIIGNTGVVGGVAVAVVAAVL